MYTPKIKVRWIKDLNLRGKSIKSVEDKILTGDLYDLKPL